MKAPPVHVPPDRGTYCLAVRIGTGERCNVGDTELWLHARIPALLADELLSQDVRVPAVLGQFAQHVEVHPSSSSAQNDVGDG